MELLRDVGQVEAHIGSVGDNFNLDARSVHRLRECTIGSEIILDALDDTPR
jgi:hypothetical protein